MESFFFVKLLMQMFDYSITFIAGYFRRKAKIGKRKGRGVMGTIASTYSITCSKSPAVEAPEQFVKSI